MVNLTGWTYLFEFGYDLFIYAKGKRRVGVDKDGKQVIAYEAGPYKSPQCQECQQAHVCNDAT